MKTQQVFINDADLEWEIVAEGMRRKIMGYDGRIMLVKVEFETGSVGANHQHYHSQITHVERGKFEVNVNGERQILNGGDAFYIPPNADHGCTCLEAGVLIDVFSPMREDFIQASEVELTPRDAVNSELLKEK